MCENECENERWHLGIVGKESEITLRIKVPYYK